MTTSVRRIGPSSERGILGISDLWPRRELLYFLAWRDMRVRYSQTFLGIVWAVLQPLVLMILFTLFFGRVAGLDSDGLPYSIFALAALVPWQLFTSSVANATESIVSNERIVTKIYFPRVLLPIASVLAALADFGIAFVLLLTLMAFNGIVPSASIALLPMFVLLAVVTALGIGIWLAALNTEYRDFRYITPFLLQAWLFATPVVFSLTAVPAAWRPLLSINPMTAVVEGFRWTLLRGTPPATATILVSSMIAVAILGSGLMWFRRVDDRIADIV